MDENTYIPPAADDAFSQPVGTGPASIAKAAAAKDSRNLAVLAHLLGIFTSFVGPLAIWLVKKDDPYVEDQSKEALNFQITVALGFVISGLIAAGTCGALFFAPLVLLVYQWVMGVIAAVKASQGEVYRYPMTVRLIK